MKLEIVESNEGVWSVYLNDYRITSRNTKPLGGGKVIKSFIVKREYIEEGLKQRY